MSASWLLNSSLSLKNQFFFWVYQMQFLLNFLLLVCFYSISVKTKSTHLQKHVSVQTVSAGNSYSSGENWDWREEGVHIQRLCWRKGYSTNPRDAWPFWVCATSWGEGFYLVAQVNATALCWDVESPSKRTWGIITWSYGFEAVLTLKCIGNLESSVQLLTE